MSWFRENWRIALLVVFVVLSTVALFAPTIGADTGPTNLQYGIDLDGGTRIRAPIVGQTAEGVGIGNDTTEIETTVANELGVEPIKVRATVQAQDGTGTVEVFENVSRPAFRDALTAAGLEPESIRDGVTERTRQTLRDVLSDKLNRLGLSGGSASLTYSTSQGQWFVVVEVPGRDAEDVRNIVTTPGRVYVAARWPGANGTYNQVPLLRPDDFQSIGIPREFNDGTKGLSVTLTQPAAQNFSDSMQQWGFTDAAQRAGQRESTCDWRENQNESGYCLLTYRDDAVVYSAGISPGLANSIESGDYVKQQTFRLITNNMSEARTLRVDLQAGALPTSLDIGNGTVSYISPTQGSQFKTFSLLAGLLAVFAVSGAVFLRYGEAAVALPMIVTALTEVVVLLGFSAAIGYPLTLPVIAGFIAVIGTGVDDLIIIADEVMAEEVSSQRVFRSRFRKAFWVIGAAAATTIIAMSPLTVLSLGDLTGFALVTILGVLVGVLVTRPAYGDILRDLVTEK